MPVAHISGLDSSTEPVPKQYVFRENVAISALARVRLQRLHRLRPAFTGRPRPPTACEKRGRTRPRRFTRARARAGSCFRSCTVRKPRTSTVRSKYVVRETQQEIVSLFPVL